MFILQMVGWLIFSCILASFVEHQVHRKLMHRKNFLSARTASFKRVFEAHALVHHKHYAEIFSDEPVARGEDKEIRLTVRKAPIKAIPIAALILSILAGGSCLRGRYDFSSLGVEQNSSGDAQAGAECLQHLAGLQVSGTTSLPASQTLGQELQCCVPSG